MKKTLGFFCMAALVLMGAAMNGCTSSELVNEQPENNDKIVTLATTVSLDVATKALDATGAKTFAAGEKMAVIYNNGTSTVKAESKALEADDLINGGKSAKFTFELETPNTSVPVTYIYPAAMAKDDGSVNYDALAEQDGTLATLSSTLDLATKTADWNGTSLPTATLDNQLAILAITLMDYATPTANDITSSIKGLNLTYGTNSYTITRSAGDGPIYVAIRPASSSADIEVTATDGTYLYGKSLSSKTYLINNGYSVSWKMNTILTRLNSGNAGSVLGGAYTPISADQAKVFAKRCWTVAGSTVFVVYSASGSLYTPNVSYASYDGTSLATANATSAMQLLALYGGGNTAWYVEPALLSLTVDDQTSEGVGAQTFYYSTGETWAQAIERHPSENAGWSISGEVVAYNGYSLCYYDEEDTAVNPTVTIDPSIDYYLIWD